VYGFEVNAIDDGIFQGNMYLIMSFRPGCNSTAAICMGAVKITCNDYNKLFTAYDQNSLKKVVYIKNLFAPIYPLLKCVSKNINVKCQCYIYVFANQAMRAILLLL